MPRPGTSATRGYGHHHRKSTATLLAALARTPGLPCPFCHAPMYVEPQLNPDGRKPQGDHGLPRALGGQDTNRLAHASCNQREGAKLGNRIRGARRHGYLAPGAPAAGTGTTSRAW